MKYQTTAAYISGGLCGRIWMPAVSAGKCFHGNVRAQIDRFSDPNGTTFRDVLLHMLMEHGGDFQSAQFTADTVLRVERRWVESPGKYRVHVYERELIKLRDCADLVDADTYTGDWEEQS